MWAALWAKADLTTLAAENITPLNQRLRQKKKKKIKNDTCQFQCELTARPPGRDTPSLSEPLAALDSVNHAAVLWSFCRTDRRATVASCSAVNQRQSLNGHDGKQREGRQGKKKCAGCRRNLNPGLTRTHWIGMRRLVSVFMALKPFSVSAAEGFVSSGSPSSLHATVNLN